jgi:hypothetical protein
MGNRDMANGPHCGPMTSRCASSGEEVGQGGAQLGDVIRAREEARRLIDGLLRRRISSLVLPSTGGASVNLRDLGQGLAVSISTQGVEPHPMMELTRQWWMLSNAEGSATTSAR